MSVALPDGPPAAPRPFRLRAVDAGTTFLLLFGGIWALVGTVITIVFVAVGGAPWDDAILDRRSASAVAAPTAVAHGNGQINGRPIYRITYAFSDGHGQAQSGATSTSDGGLVRAARSGPPLTIEYDPLRPQRSRIQNQRASAFGVFLLIPTMELLTAIPPAPGRVEPDDLALARRLLDDLAPILSYVKPEPASGAQQRDAHHAGGGPPRLLS